MEKNNLGQIIHKTLQQFYPNTQLPIKSYEIQDILDKAKIDKRNSNKEEISKIIKILKHHIEIAKQNKIQKVEPQEYKPLFTNMENENSYLDKMRDDLADNLKKLEEEQTRKVETEKFNESLVVKNFINEEQKEFEYNIIIDSKDRDYDLYNSSANFSISLGVNNYGNDKKGLINRNFEEVVSIELTELFLKQTRGVTGASDNTTTPSYLLLQIEELGSRYEGTNDMLNKTFARLYDFEDLALSGSVTFREYQCNNFIKVFNPRRNLNKLSIKLLNPDGTAYSLGDNDKDQTDTMLSLGFKIVVLQKTLVTNYIDKTN